MLTSDSFVTHGSVSQTLRVLNERERGREWASDLVGGGKRPQMQGRGGIGLRLEADGENRSILGKI